MVPLGSLSAALSLDQVREKVEGAQRLLSGHVHPPIPAARRLLDEALAGLAALKEHDQGGARTAPASSPASSPARTPAEPAEPAEHPGVNATPASRRPETRK